MDFDEELDKAKRSNKADELITWEALHSIHWRLKAVENMTLANMEREKREGHASVRLSVESLRELLKGEV